MISACESDIKTN